MSSADAVPISLPGLIPGSSDPTRDVATASRLVRNIDVAERVKQALNSSLSAREAAQEGDGGAGRLEQHRRRHRRRRARPDEAAELANAFAAEAVAELTEELHTAIDDSAPAASSRASGRGPATRRRSEPDRASWSSCAAGPARA